MTDINKLTLVGRLTRDLEVKYTQGGMAIGSFCIAVNRSQKKGDTWEDKTSFFDCTLFGKFAENQKQYLTKGTQVVITGSLNQERWQNKEGQNQSKVTILVDTVQRMGSVKNGGNSNNFQQEQEQFAQNEGGFPEDCPF